MILIGIFRAHKEGISNLYSEDPNLSKPIIKCAMPRDRFKVILRFLRFDDPSTRLERSLLDKLAPIRHVFDSINASLNRSYSPGKWLTVDEHMARYRGKCPIRQYLPAKPDKYGIKVFILADSKTYYPFVIEAYTGKSKLNNSPEDIVLRLCSYLRLGHIVVGDNYLPL